MQSKTFKWLSILVIFSLSTFVIFKNLRFKSREIPKNSFTNTAVGTSFPLQFVEDKNGNKITTSDFTTDLTIIDLWFFQCPACIQEMNQFEGLLSDKEGEISILSISVDTKTDWLSVFDKKSQFKMLKMKYKGGSTELSWIPTLCLEELGNLYYKHLKRNPILSIL